VFVVAVNDDDVAVRIESGRTRESYVMPSKALKKCKWKDPHRVVVFKSADVPASTVKTTLALGTFMDISLMGWLLLNKHFTSVTQIFDDLIPMRVAPTPAWQNPFLADVCRLSVSYRLLRRRLSSYPSLVSLLYSTELPIAHLLLKMTSRGVPYKTTGLKKAEKVLLTRLSELKAQLPAALNPSSPQQVHAYLYDTLQLPSSPRTAGGARENMRPRKQKASTCGVEQGNVQRTGKTQAGNEEEKRKQWCGTDDGILDKLAPLHPHVGLIQEYRKVMKTLGSFVRPYLSKAEPNIHATFLQTATVTGRFSCQDPNLQQVPTNLSSGLNLRHVVFAPPAHCLVTMDYAQMEVRMLAHFVGEGPLRNAFLDTHADVYVELAKHVFATPDITAENRNLMKTVVLSIIYGSGKQLIADKLGIPVELATKFSRDFHAAFPEVSKWQKDMIREAQETGFCQTITGRRRFLPMLQGGATSWEKKSEARRHCINTIIQGSSADLLKRAMLNCDHALQTFPAAIRPELILCIHDELMFQTPSAIQKDVIRIMRREMVGAGRGMGLQVLFPTVAKSGKSWGTLKIVN